MKKIIYLIISGVVFISCNQEKEPAINLNNLPGHGDHWDINYGYENRPDDIPMNLCDGTPVYWDGIWQRSYVNNRIEVKYNEEGTCVEWISREIYDSNAGSKKWKHEVK